MGVQDLIDKAKNSTGGEFADSWRPANEGAKVREVAEANDPGDTLAGTVVKIGTRSGKYSEYAIITVEQEDGEQLAFHAFRSVAAEEVENADPREGDNIAIVYKGVETAQKSGNDVHIYRVACETPGEGDEDRPF